MQIILVFFTFWISKNRSKSNRIYLDRIGSDFFKIIIQTEPNRMWFLFWIEWYFASKPIQIRPQTPLLATSKITFTDSNYLIQVARVWMLFGAFVSVDFVFGGTIHNIHDPLTRTRPTLTTVHVQHLRALPMCLGLMFVHIFRILAFMLQNYVCIIWQKYNMGPVKKYNANW